MTPGETAKASLNTSSGGSSSRPRNYCAFGAVAYIAASCSPPGLDLVILKRLFLAVKEDEIAELVKQKPTGLYTRTASAFSMDGCWSDKLNLPAAKKVSYVDAVDIDLQYASSWQNSVRHRVRNNLPGIPDFCSLVFKTQALPGRLIQGCVGNLFE
ncbi:hypothetical protein [Bradyrhizobium valentinum]|uniref:Uncharacterized protein n=1 Tax=Bradyrhizobium valentinum TaxID=1518501 RepID=A0A0R3L8N1_9BRAD|nr:hypothetical protein [Bradyrhizobium valentinum]KRR02077.1 hypothetical protein CP49_04660 [Bradyrhizobium valentinum]